MRWLRNDAKHAILYTKPQAAVETLQENHAMTNIYDIAKRAQVSASTVSRVLNNTAPIGEETRRRVLMIAKELGYQKRPYASASNPARMSNIAGVIIPDMKSDSYTSLMHNLNERFKQKGFSTLFAATNFDQDETIRAVENMSKIHVRCLLVVIDDTETISQKLIESVQTTMLPVMFITSKYLSDVDVDCIYLDESWGNTIAVEHLLHRGYRRIGFIGEPNTQNRLDFFLEIMRRHGIEVNPDFIHVGPERGEDGGYKRMREILNLPEIPDAIYASYDQMAIGAIHALQESGLRVPQDVAVIGFDDIPIARYICGGITTVRTSFDDMAAIVVRILTHRLQHPEGQIQQVAVKPTLVVRATT